MKQVRGKTKSILRYFSAAALALLLVITTVPAAVFAVPDPALTGGSPVTSYSGSAVSITDVQVTGTGNPTVPVKLRVTSGTLAMGTTTGLTFTGGSSGSTLQFSGTKSNVNAALATLTYTRTGTGTDTLEASLVNPGEVFSPDTGHLYEYVSYTASWNNANTNAQTRTKYGATGYLTTVTSQAENDFVAARLLNAGWMGASDSASEGDWKWVTGPEAGTSFWSGTSSGSAVSGRYANWGSGEPNNAGDEDCAQFLTGGTGKWNDLPCSTTTLPGYVVEYGSPGSPIDVSSLNVSITTLAANNAPTTPSNLGPTAQVNGSWVSDAGPVLSFTLADADAGNTVHYRVQIDDTANFSSPVVDYRSEYAAPGARTFAVGQAVVGSGSYVVGSVGQSLPDGNYYWRVRATDNVGAVSSYATANSGGIAFRVDTTAPSVPTGLAITSQNNDTTPSFSWTASTDASSGLHSSTPYTVQWSTDPAFATATNTTVATNSFTVANGNALADGTWYFRVRAKDTLNQNSAYSTSKSLVIDTTAPSAPGAPTATTGKDVNTPTWQWTASTDAGVGLASPAYWVEWSQSVDFSGSVHTITAAGASYTHSASLADGTWYFRVKAVDSNSNESGYSAIGQLQIDTTVPVVAASTSPGAPTKKAQVAMTRTDDAVPVTIAPTAQTETIPVVRVLVVDENGKPVQGAKVTLHSNPRVAYSGADGYAVFRDVEAGQHNIVVEYGGTTKQQPLAITASDQNVLANVTLANEIASAPKKTTHTADLRLWIVGLLIVSGFFMIAAVRRKKHKEEASK